MCTLFLDAHSEVTKPRLLAGLRETAMAALGFAGPTSFLLSPALFPLFIFALYPDVGLSSLLSVVCPSPPPFISPSALHPPSPVAHGDPDHPDVGPPGRGPTPTCGSAGGCGCGPWPSWPTPGVPRSSTSSTRPSGRTSAWPWRSTSRCARCNPIPRGLDASLPRCTHSCECER